MSWKNEILESHKGQTGFFKEIEQKQSKMEYFKKLQKHHESAGAILEKLIAEKKTIENLEASQANFKRMFGETSPQFAFDVLVAHRKIKMLSRGYSKIMKQINL